MNIFRQEFKSNLKSTIIWTISIVGLIVLYMSLYPGFAKDAQMVKDMMANLPEPVRKGLGFNPDLFLSILGFYSFTFLYILLLGSIQAMNLGISMLSKETREKTADFLLTKPVTREQIVTAKLLSALTSLIITNIVFIVVSYFTIELVKIDDYKFNIFLMISVTLFFVQLLFMSLGFILSVLISKIKSVISISLPIVFGFFIISMLGSVIGDELVSYITPFKYFDREHIIFHGTYETSYIILELVIIIVSIIATYIVYHFKDIHSI
ncbi:ABC transporter permease subunit [Mycoplasmatota bacterium]|nr:ABC transporter permease subunit [Mycoplasmatota bacterium]